MAGAQLPCFHDTFIRIAEGLKLLKQIHVTEINASENLYTAKNADAEVPVVGAKIQSSPASQSNPSFRKRKRKQENDKIFRVDLAKAEEEDVLEQLKAEECRYFVKYFGELLPNFTPGDAVLNETANLSQNLEVCKRLIGRAGRFIREKNIELEAENTRVEELEEILSREQKFKEELKSGLVELQDTVKAIVAATEEGSKTNCLYCSSVLRELGEQKNQDMVEFVLKPPKTDHLTLSESAVISDANVVAECETPAKNALEEALPLNSIEMSSEVFPLKRLKNGPDGSSDEMELYIRTSEISTKSNGSPKSNEKFQNMLLMNCKSSSVFPEFQQPGNVTGVYLQREAKEPTRSYGKEIDIHQIHINMEEGKQSKSVGDANERENGEGNECKCVGDGNGKENGAVDSGESQAKMSTVRVVDGNECKSVGDGIEKENGAVDSGESQANMSTVRVMEEELCGPVENCERTGLYNDSASMSDIKEGYGFIEMKCGCTSRDQIDTLGTLRIYESGAFEIYCQCKRGCNNGIVDVFFTVSSIKRWGSSSRKGESFFCRFIATNDDKHTSFQLLATKGDNEVVTARLAASTEYGTHNALPSYIGVLQPNRVHRHNIHLLSYKVFNHIRSQHIIRSESYVEIPCSDESFMVTFELIAMHSVPPGIVKKNNSVEFNIEGYENLKEAVFYTWPTFPDRYQPTSGSSDQTQPLGKWRVGPKFRFRYLYNSLQPRVQVHFSWDSHQWDLVHQCYGLGMRTGVPHLDL